MLDDVGIYRLLQLMHVCDGGDKDLANRQITLRWREGSWWQKPCTKNLATDAVREIADISGTIIGVERIDLPLHPKCVCLVVQAPGVTGAVAIPYHALIFGVEVDLELPG
jgi:hypothetical protein